MDVEGGTVTRVGVALSGGGHRASGWAAGLLLYLADAGRNGDIGVIASVSGGSITNGVVAQQMDSRQARADEVRDGLGPLLHHIAYTGLFFWGPSTNLYVITVLGVLGLGLLGILAGLVMAFITGIGIAAGIVLGASLAARGAPSSSTARWPVRISPGRAARPGWPAWPARSTTCSARPNCRRASISTSPPGSCTPTGSAAGSRAAWPCRPPSRRRRA